MNKQSFSSNKDFIKSILSLRGKVKGKKWLDNIPNLVKTYETKWGLKSKGTFPGLSINFVERVQTKNGEDLVLKIGFLGDEEFLREVKALRIYGGNGAIKILKEDLDNSVILLEACIPGNPLHTIENEEKEILIFTNICKRIWTKVPEDSGFAKLADESKYFDWYFANIEKCKDSLPEDLVIKAQKVFKDLINSQGDLYLLHADLHHDNILNSERGWLSIDPKGIIGEREYEPSVYILNPYKRFKENEELIKKDFFAKRVKLISKALNLNEERVAKWAFIKQILALIWSLQDYGIRDKISIRNARELEKLL